MIKTIHFLTVIVAILISSSCGGLPAVHKHLTDEIYLTAPDEIEQLSVVYHESGDSYSDLVVETVMAVGYNDEFVIVKRSPRNQDTTLYYIIDIKEIKKGRENFVSKTDTIRSRSNYKDIHGKDSLGSEDIRVSTSSFYPKNPEPLTFKDFSIKRKEMNIPDSLDFTIKYEDFIRNKDEQ